MEPVERPADSPPLYRFKKRGLEAETTIRRGAVGPGVQISTRRFAPPFPWARPGPLLRSRQGPGGGGIWDGGGSGSLTVPWDILSSSFPSDCVL